MKIARYGRFWAVFDGDGGLVCVTVYRKGAQEVVNRLTAHPHAHWCRYCRTPAVCTTATCTPTTEWICPAWGSRSKRRKMYGKAPGSLWQPLNV